MSISASSWNLIIAHSNNKKAKNIGKYIIKKHKLDGLSTLTTQKNKIATSIMYMDTPIKSKIDIMVPFCLVATYTYFITNKYIKQHVVTKMQIFFISQCLFCFFNLQTKA